MSQEFAKLNCNSGWNRYRKNHPEHYAEWYEKCGCCKDCMQLKGGHYCKSKTKGRGSN